MLTKGYGSLCDVRSMAVGDSGKGTDTTHGYFPTNMVTNLTLEQLRLRKQNTQSI